MQETTNTPKMETITATQIAEGLAKQDTRFDGIKASDVNKALVEMGYMKPAEKGGYILLKEGFGEQKQANGTAGSVKVPYIRWNDVILRNGILKRVLSELTSRSSEVIEEAKKIASSIVASTVVPVEKKAHSEKKPFDRKTFEAPFLTSSGHYVRSQAEMIVANWLYSNGILFSYERRLPIEKEAYCDFFIPGKNVYIEYWGYENKPEYLARKKVKQDIYKENGFNLVEICIDDLKIIDDMLAIKLLKFGVRVY
jgi:hypothetical protein